MKKILKYFLSIFGFLFLIACIYFFAGTADPAEDITWGVNFSQKYSTSMGLDWKENYLALLDDLEFENIKIAVHWDLIEKEKDKFDFSDLDWQIKEAEERGVKVILAIGMKTPRWPECHLPLWAWDLDKKEQQEEILEMLEGIVLRYKDSSSISSWQVENEAFFDFGVCPWSDEEFLEKEVELVKSLDWHPVLITDSGEWSFWLRAADIGDIVGTTMYKKVYMSQLNFYFDYFFPSVFYQRKALLIDTFFDKKVICAELQAEPWCPDLIYSCSKEEQEKTMDKDKLLETVEFAKNTGFDTFYFWGGEWWYWLKEIENDPSVWNEVKKIIN